MKPHILLATTAFLCAHLTAAPQQVGDLRIGANNYPGTDFFFDLGFTEGTRGVLDAPVQLPSVFSGTTSVPGAVGNTQTDLGLRTFSTSTHLQTLNRFTSDPDGPGPLGGPARVGAFQYEIDLTPLEAYLSGSGETLTELDLRFVIDPSDDTRKYDIYLSYTDAVEGITLKPISVNDPAANYNDFWFPSQSAAEGDVVNGTHKILNLQTVGDIDQSTSMLALYNAGVRKVNVIITSGAFLNARQLKINAPSGLWVNTSGLGALTQVGNLILPSGAFSAAYTYFDRINPLTTAVVVGAPFNMPSQLSGTSQNQGDNEAGPLAFFNLDATEGNTGCTAGGTAATVVGYGTAGITATTADAFQFTAWKRSGDFDVNVRIDSLSSLGSAARAGLMVRGGSGADAAHVFLGLQQTGEPVVVVRDANGNSATETLGSVLTFPQTLRIRRVGDVFSFYLATGDTPPGPNPSATVVMSDPVLVGLAATSGSDANSATAVFSAASVFLADPTSDIGLRTYSTSTTIKTLSRFASTTAAGMVQWELDLSPLGSYLGGASLNLDSLELRLLGSASDATKPFDVYLSYTNPAESIELAGITPRVASNTNLAVLNYGNFFAPAIGATAGDIVNGTHQVLVAATPGDINLTQDLLPLYNAGVRKLNLMIASNQFYSIRTLTISEGSGLFIETSSGSTPFANFMANYPGLTGDDALAGADPDADGLSNVAEFIMGGTAPNDGGAANRAVDGAISGHLTLSLLVPSGASFAGSPSPAATVEGVNVSVGGTLELATFDRIVEETALNPGLPTAPAGYEWHSFRLSDPISSQPRGFLRASFEQP
jgi:hypothetical protein